MDWTWYQVFDGINGVDVALWLLAYGSWRALTSRRAEQRQAAPAVTTCRRPAVERSPIAQVQMVDRWAGRSEQLEKLRRPVARRSVPRRTDRRAA